MYRFDITTRQWLAPRASDEQDFILGGRVVSIQRHMRDYLTKMYFARYQDKTVYEIKHNGQADGEVTLENTGITTTLWARQILIPVYYHELLINV